MLQVIKSFDSLDLYTKNIQILCLILIFENKKSFVSLGAFCKLAKVILYKIYLKLMWYLEFYLLKDDILSVFLFVLVSRPRRVTFPANTTDLHTLGII